MKTQNLFSLCQGLNAIQENNLIVEESYKYLKSNEITTVQAFCDWLQDGDVSYSLFNGYIVGYSIPQISKEFDLLRFSDDLIVDIELKGELAEDIKYTKILKQMQKNYYYLKFLNKRIKIYTFVENDGVYEYDYKNDKIREIDAEELIEVLEEQIVSEEIDIANMFKPSNYLISPFNKTEQFIQGEYFLTSDQETTKTDILNKITEGNIKFFCVSATAGTGKTLLLYDIAKNYRTNKDTLIVHCGKLNRGHIKLQEDYEWNIISVKDINQASVCGCIHKNMVIIVDEAQRMRERQLRLLINTAIAANAFLIFSYDVEQYLSEGESRDIKEYLEKNYSQYSVYYKVLTNKIRTNKQIASFIHNLKRIGSSNAYLDYKDVSIEYFQTRDEAKEYVDYLSEMCGWTVITYTNSQYSREPLDKLAIISDIKAHDVIGQEFDKVALIMDDNFIYDQQGVLNCKTNYYSTKGMFYQIVTRVVNKLKIIVLNNPPLYEKLLEIKSMHT